MCSRPTKPAVRGDLWRTVAHLRDKELCRTDWQRRLGDGFAPMAQFLIGLPGTVASTFPDPESGLPLVPRRIHDGTYTARPDDPDVTRVAPVTGLTAVQVLRWRLDWERIGGAVSQALGLAPHRGEGPFETPWVCDVGVLRSGEKAWTALLLVADSDKQALGWARHLLRGDPQLFILPFHDPVLADLASEHGHRCVCLDRETTFAKAKGRWELQGVPCAADGFAVPDPRGPWSTGTLEMVDVVGDFNAIRFADGFEVSFYRQSLRRAYLTFLMKRCGGAVDFVFDHETIRKDYNDTRPVRKIKADRLRHDLFRNCSGFDRIFETLDLRAERYRLLIRRR